MAFGPKASVVGTGGGTETGSLRAGGRDRTYLLHLPPARPRAVLPLIVALHGAGGDGRGMERLSGLSRLADREGFAVAYPDGLWRQWNDGRSGIHLTHADDVGFLRALIGHLTGEAGMDPQRVYVTGISNGGMMSQRLACDAADKIAAIASIAATLPEAIQPDCKPQRPVSVLLMHGTNDPLVPYLGGAVAGPGGRPSRGRVLSLDATARFWAAADGCAGGPEVASLPDRADDGTTVRVARYQPCRHGAAVAAYTIEGGGHTWPCGFQYLPVFLIGKTSRDLDAGETMWEFFRRASR